MEAIAGASAPTSEVPDPIDEIERILAGVGRERLTGVVSTDDYPGTTLAAAIAESLGLPAPSPTANLLCQHKYLARLAQREFAPEAVPAFSLIDVDKPADLGGVCLPAMVKPVKSFFSVGATQISSPTELRELQSHWAAKDSFFQPFERLLQTFTGHSVGRDYLVAEELLTGLQCTLEGYAFGDEIRVMGVVDSIMFPRTTVFQRFEYPSSLPRAAQDRMATIARKVMGGLGYRDGMFNIEFMYEPEADRVSIIEINPRMASQFADLFEKVDGFNSYSVLLDLARGRRPRTASRQGEHRMAASCVLRTFSDRRVVALPSAGELDALARRYPDVRVEVLATLGLRLSDEMQDGQSFRYGIIDLGGRDRTEVLEKLDDCMNRLSFGLVAV